MSVAGRYKNRVLLEKYTITQDAGTNEPVYAWAVDSTVWAKVHPVSGNETLLAHQVAPEITYIVEIRAPREKIITPDMRILVPVATGFTDLDEPINDSETVLCVNAPYPHDLDFYILVDSELMIVTSQVLIHLLELQVLLIIESYNSLLHQCQTLIKKQ